MEIRLFSVVDAVNIHIIEFTDVLGKGQKSFTYFSATCWLFGRRLFETLGYPIGLLASDYGGTPDEAWMSPDALKQCGLDAVQEPFKR